MEGKRFNLQSNHDTIDPRPSIPWDVARLAYAVYHAKYPGQDMEMLSSRGGFCHREMDEFLPGWRKMADDYDNHRADAIEKGEG